MKNIHGKNFSTAKHIIHNAVYKLKNTNNIHAYLSKDLRDKIKHAYKLRHCKDTCMFVSLVDVVYMKDKDIRDSMYIM